MRITDISTSRFQVALRQPFVTALGTDTAVQGIRVRATDSDGRIGLGEAVATTTITGETLAGIEAAINGPLRAAVLGGRLDELDPLLRRMDATIVRNGSAKAAIDIALHDLWGQWLGRPLHILLGGARSEVITDMTISLDDPDKMASTAQQIVAEGFGCLKAKLGRPPDVDLRRVRAIRAAAGPSATIRVDANQAWSSKEAIAIIRSFEDEDLGVELVEQPVPAADLEGLAHVTRTVATPVMADESCFSPADALALVRHHAADALNIKLMKCGGLRPALAIVAIAEAAGIKCSVGCMMEGMVSSTAAACLAAGRSSISSVDLDAPLWLVAGQSAGSTTWNGERITVGEAPGLGISVPETEQK